MSFSTFIGTEQKYPSVPLWAVINPNVADVHTVRTEQKYPSVPLWAVINPDVADAHTVRTEQRNAQVPLWAVINPDVADVRTMETEPPDSQPFIDSLTPVTVGSDWRLAVMMAAKLDDNVPLPALVPAPSDTVIETSTIFIPCGDRIPEIGDALIWTDEDPGYVLPSGVPGLLDDRTIILVNGVLAYMNGSPQNGWSVAFVVNKINGFNYTLTGPGGLIPQGTVTVSVYLEGVESFQDSYQFTSTPRPAGGIDSIFVVAKDLIKINFIGTVAVVKSLFDPTIYDLSGLGGSTDINAVEVLPLGDGVRTTTYIFLRITQPDFGGDYQISVAEGALFNSSGDGLAATTVTWTHYRTKVDTVLKSFPKMYSKGPRSILRSILEAIMISDEEIGGDS